MPRLGGHLRILISSPLTFISFSKKKKKGLSSLHFTNSPLPGLCKLAREKHHLVGNISHFFELDVTRLMFVQLKDSTENRGWTISFLGGWSSEASNRLLETEK